MKTSPEKSYKRYEWVLVTIFVDLLKMMEYFLGLGVEGDLRLDLSNFIVEK